MSNPRVKTKFKSDFANKFFASAIFTVLIIALTNSAASAGFVGSKCVKGAPAIKVANSKYICTLVGKKYVWTKSSIVKVSTTNVATVTKNVKPEVTPSQTPPTVSTPTPTATPVTPPAPPEPKNYAFKVIYLTNTGATTDRTAAIHQDMVIVKNWFKEQLGGRTIRIANINDIMIIRDTDLNNLKNLDSSGVARQWHETGVVAPDQIPLVFAEGKIENMGACGWSGPNYDNGGVIWIPMANCDIYPNTASKFPYYSTYLIAHEVTHQLGADHVQDDNRDVVYNGPGNRDWDHIALDPNHNDYFRTGDPNKPDIEKSPLLTD